MRLGIYLGSRLAVLIHPSALRRHIRSVRELQVAVAVWRLVWGAGGWRVQLCSTRLGWMTTPPETRFEEIRKREEGLHRTLSSAQLAMIAIGGAIGTGLFLGSSFAISFAGPSVLVSYAIGAVIALLLMGCMAEMTVAHPTAGSFGAWAEFYVSPLAGFLVRYAYWAGVVFALGTEVTAVAVYMRYWFPGVAGWVWISGFTALLVLVNAINVRIFGWVEYLFSSIKVFAIVAFLLLGTVFLLHSGIGLKHYSRPFFAHGFGGMWVAVLVSLFSFFSIETIAVAAGEAKDPERAITQAFRATMLRLALFYLLTLAIILAIVPWQVTAAGGQQSPFVTVMAATRIPYAAAIVNAVILIAALSAMNSQLYVATRMMFSLARGGSAPRVLGTLTKSGVPVYALLVSTIGIAFATLLNLRFHDRSFLILLSIAIFGPMFTWLMIFVTHLRFRQRHAGKSLPFQMWGYPYTSLLGAGLMLAALLTTPFTAAFKPTLAYGVPLLIILTAAYLLRRQAVPKS